MFTTLMFELLLAAYAHIRCADAARVLFNFSRIRAYAASFRIKYQARAPPSARTLREMDLKSKITTHPSVLVIR